MSNCPLNDDGELPFPDDSEKPKKRPPSRWWQKTYIPIPLLIAICLLLICSAVLLLGTSMTNGSLLCQSTSFCTSAHKLLQRLTMSNDPRPPHDDPSVYYVYLPTLMSEARTPITATPATYAQPRCDPAADYRDHVMMTIGWDSNAEIFLTDLSGAQLCRVTDNFIQEMEVDWSPDRKRIAFVAKRRGEEHTDVYVMNFDGSNVVDLTRDRYDEQFPTWSPDGTRIVYSSNLDGAIHLFVIDADGSNWRAVTSDETRFDSDPVWSPNGSKLAFTTSTGQYGHAISVVDVDTLAQVYFIPTQAISLFAWLPDGSSLAALIPVFDDGTGSRDDDLAQIELATGETRSLARLPIGSAATLILSPDGQLVAFHDDGVPYILDLASQMISPLPIGDRLLAVPVSWR